MVRPGIVPTFPLWPLEISPPIREIQPQGPTTHHLVQLIPVTACMISQRVYVIWFRRDELFSAHLGFLEYTLWVLYYFYLKYSFPCKLTLVSFKRFSDTVLSLIRRGSSLHLALLFNTFQHKGPVRGVIRNMMKYSWGNVSLCDAVHRIFMCKVNGWTVHVNLFIVIYGF